MKRPDPPPSRRKTDARGCPDCHGAFACERHWPLGEPNPGAPPEELAAFDAGHAIGVRRCIAIMLRRHGNDYSAVDTLAELRALLPKETPT